VIPVAVTGPTGGAPARSGFAHPVPTSSGPSDPALTPDGQADPPLVPGGGSPDPPLAPGGRPADPAISWRGRRHSYADLEELIAAAVAGMMGAAAGANHGGTSGSGSTGLAGAAAAGSDRVVTPPLDPAPRDLASLDLPEALACAFAAARTGTAVLVRDPALPAPAIGSLPAGTWLVAGTSGSTAAPRAVCRTAASWARSVGPLARLAGLTSGDRVLLTGPLHGTMHLHAALHTLAIGAELTDRADTATAVHALPAVLEVLLRDLPADAPLRTAVLAGAALPDRIAALAADRGVAVTEYYGAAELSFVAIRRLPEPVLRPFPGVRVRLDAGGTLWARSPYLALGYAGGDGALRPLRTDPDGYATVGDLADAPDGDPQRGLVIRGRGDSAITTGGFTVLVEDVEAALAALPGVRAVAVVGMPHPRLGELVTAVLEPHPGADLSGVPAAARRLLTGPARPRRYLVADALPRTGGGKVARAAVRESLPSYRVVSPTLRHGAASDSQPG
jgi:hypothetical protein